VVDHLLRNGVPRGPEGVARVLVACPYLLLCKPSNNDRWDRRAIELAAYWHKHGHTNVPADTAEVRGEGGICSAGVAGRNRHPAFAFLFQAFNLSVLNIFFLLY
jgi:hypothetical protein